MKQQYVVGMGLLLLLWGSLVSAETENVPSPAEAAVADGGRGEAETDVLLKAVEEKISPPPGRQPFWKRPEPPKKILPMLFYLSFRGHLVNEDSGLALADGGTRAGVLYAHKFKNENELSGHAEMGFNLVDSLTGLVTPDANAVDGNTGTTFTPRLYYLAYERDGVKAFAGKNWSAYYEVAGLTDRLAAFGGRAAGVYNAGTDGGGSGTGRADNTLQLRGRWDTFTLRLQGQILTQMPTFDERFDYGLGAGLRVAPRPWFELGLAYNLAAPSAITEEMRTRGLTGNDQAMALATRVSYQRFSVATVYSQLRNHEADTDDFFYNARGIEVYTRYGVNKALRLVAGWNYLVPHDATYPGLVRTEAYFVGAHYTFRERNFDDMFYVEYAFNEGRSAEGNPLDNAVAIGFRYKFTR